MSLIDTWIAAERENGCDTTQSAINKMNKAVGSIIKSNRVWEWGAGVQRPPIKITNYMLKTCILYSMRKIKPRIGLTDNEIIKLADMLALPKRKD